MSTPDAPARVPDAVLAALPDAVLAALLDAYRASPAMTGVVAATVKPALVGALAAECLAWRKAARWAADPPAADGVYRAWLPHLDVERLVWVRRDMVYWAKAANVGVPVADYVADGCRWAGPLPPPPEGG
jgi:hypothetical protein